MSNDFDDFQPPSDEPDFGNGAGDDGFSDDSPGAPSNGASKSANASGAEAEPKSSAGANSDADAATKDSAGDQGAAAEDAPNQAPPGGPGEPLSIGGPHADFIDVQGEVMDETTLQMIAAAVQADIGRSKADSNIIFNHGPMAELAKQFNELIKNQCPHAGVTEALQHHMNIAFHDAAQEFNSVLFREDGTPNNERTLTGLAARKDALEAARVRFSTNAGQLMGALNAAGYPIRDLHQMIDSNMTNRVKQMESMMESSRPMTLGDSLIMGIQDKFAKTFSNGDMAGDVRDYNNRVLNDSLFKLKHVSAEIRFNAGKPVWESGDGRAAQAEASKLLREIEEITKGRESSINARTLKAHMDEAQQNISEAAGLTADPDLQERLREIAKNMAAMVERIVNTIKKAFSHLDGAKPT